MAIDTAEKRSSCFEVPGLMFNPFPDGTRTQSDRVHMADIYSGITVAGPSVLPSETCWQNSLSNSSAWKASQTNSSTWKNSQRNGSTWKSAQANTSTWRRSGSVTPTWVKEEEVQPCQD